MPDPDSYDDEVIKPPKLLSSQEHTLTETQLPLVIHSLLLEDGMWDACLEMFKPISIRQPHSLLNSSLPSDDSQRFIRHKVGLPFNISVYHSHILRLCPTRTQPKKWINIIFILHVTGPSVTVFAQ